MAEEIMQKKITDDIESSRSGSDPPRRGKTRHDIIVGLFPLNGGRPTVYFDNEY